jgi:hypothetical protein
LSLEDSSNPVRTSKASKVAPSLWLNLLKILDQLADILHLQTGSMMAANSCSVVVLKATQIYQITSFVKSLRMGSAGSGSLWIEWI